MQTFNFLCNNEKITLWFPELFVTQLNTQLDVEKLRRDGIQYIARISATTRYSNISGTIESVDNSIDVLHFEWKLTQDPDQKDWTRLTMNFNETKSISKSRWW